MTISRRTPLKRTPFKQRWEGPTSARESKPQARTEVKAKTCAYEKCGRPFIPLRQLQTVCSPVCASRKVRADKLAERARDRAARDSLLTVKQLKAKAQDAFNAWIKLRDADLPCVSCGVVSPPERPGGRWDAGHFLSRGAYPELAFEPLNCWKQCKSCNAGGGKFAHKERTVTAAYEAELLRRIGPERLAWLKGPHPVPKLDRDELRALAADYRAKFRHMKKERQE